MRDLLLFLSLSGLLISCGPKIEHNFPKFSTSNSYFIPYVDEFVEDCKLFDSPKKCERAYDTPINAVPRDEIVAISNDPSTVGLCLTVGKKSEIYVSSGALETMNYYTMRALVYHELCHSQPFDCDHNEELVGYHNIYVPTSIMHSGVHVKTSWKWKEYVKELFTGRSELEKSMREKYFELRSGYNDQIKRINFGPNVSLTEQYLKLETDKVIFQYYFYYNEENRDFSPHVYYNHQGFDEDGYPVSEQGEIAYADIEFNYTSKSIKTPHLEYKNNKIIPNETEALAVKRAPASSL